MCCATWNRAVAKMKEMVIVASLDLVYKYKEGFLVDPPTKVDTQHVLDLQLVAPNSFNVAGSLHVRRRYLGITTLAFYSRQNEPLFFFLWHGVNPELLFLL